MIKKYPGRGPILPGYEIYILKELAFTYFYAMQTVK